MPPEQTPSNKGPIGDYERTNWRIPGIAAIGIMAVVAGGFGLKAAEGHFNDAKEAVEYIEEYDIPDIPLTPNPPSFDDILPDIPPTEKTLEDLPSLEPDVIQENSIRDRAEEVPPVNPDREKPELIKDPVPYLVQSYLELSGAEKGAAMLLSLSGIGIFAYSFRRSEQGEDWRP